MSLEESSQALNEAFVGSLIAGRYEVTRFIAKGGMGAVFEARQLEPLERRVAIKALRLQSDDPLYRRRFFNEAAMSASLTHPNVVQVFDYGVAEDGTCYIVMELLEGEPLSSLLKREQTVSPQLALQVVADVCSALMAAHAAGFVHRDIKPSNLFVVDRQARGLFVKMLDFGLAKRLTVDASLTQTGTFLGSPQYMSPEQITGAKVTEATDVYNLGLVLFRMLAGRPPFVGEVSSAILVEHATKAPPTIREANPEAPDLPHIEWIVAVCLRKVPSERFATAEELAKAVEATLLLITGQLDELTMDLRDGMLFLPAGVELPSQMQAQILRPQALGRLVEGPQSTMVLATAALLGGSGLTLLGSGLLLAAVTYYLYFR